MVGCVRLELQGAMKHDLLLELGQQRSKVYLLCTREPYTLQSARWGKSIVRAVGGSQMCKI